MSEEEPKVTFIVTNDLPAEKVLCEGENEPITWETLNWRSNPFFQKHRKILVNHIVDYRLKAYNFSNGFVSLVFAAYSRHHHLILSADDIWIAITTAFSRFVNANAEEMREIFVSHKGTKELEVNGVGRMGGIDWNRFLDQMAQLIESNTNSEIREWIIPNFTTTTPTIRTVGAITLMSAMKKYFSYSVTLSCGIPAVTLRGTLGDWELLRHKIERLKDFQQPVLTEWYHVLVPILDQFVSSYCGNVDQDFWNRCCCRLARRSGPDFLEGWILAFVPFNEDNKYILPPYSSIMETNSYGKVRTKDIAMSAVHTPVVVNDNGYIIKTIFYAGHLFPIRGPTDDSLQSYIGWTIVEDHEESQNANKLPLGTNTSPIHLSGIPLL
jgi:hypothetical protein